MRIHQWLGLDPGDGRWFILAFVTIGLMIFGIGALGWWWVIFPGLVLTSICLRKLEKYHRLTED